MPRSGTSLIELIISYHEEVHGAGEIIKMAKIEDIYKNKFAKNKKYPSSIKFIDDKIIDELSKDFEGKAVIGKIDVDANQEFAAKYGVRNIPTVLLIKDGEQVSRQVGVAPKKTYEDAFNAAL